jgi:hypothetical protein
LAGRVGAPDFPDSFIGQELAEAVAGAQPGARRALEVGEGGGRDAVQPAVVPGLEEAAADPGSDGGRRGVQAVGDLVDGEIAIGAEVGQSVVAVAGDDDQKGASGEGHHPVPQR